MKHKNLMTRLMACVLALVMAVGIGMTPAMAGSPWDVLPPEGPAAPPFSPGTDGSLATNTVTVNDAVPGAEYKLYKLLQLEHKEVDGTKEIATYRYSYDATIKTTIDTLVKTDAFRYEPKTGDADTNPRHGFGFKVDGNNVVFITPAIIDSKTGDVDYNTEENAIVRTMMVEFADELRKLVDAGSLTAFGDSKTATTTTVSFTGVPNGYWMITSNAGARSIVFTSPEEADISKEVVVNEKNPAPVVEKKVFDYDDVAGKDKTTAAGSWKDVSDAQIGETVEYKITVYLYNGAENIIVHDEMTDGLTFKELNGAKFYPRKNATEYGREVYPLGGGDPTTEPLELTETGADGKRVFKADVATLLPDDDMHGFTLTFKNAFVNPAADASNRDQADAKNNVFLGDLSTLEDDGGKVEIEYAAVLNKDAVINGDSKLICGKVERTEHAHTDACRINSNVNDAYVKYGHIEKVGPGVEPSEVPEAPTDPPRTSNHDETKTYTYRFKIDKFVKDDSTAKLAGAEFELRQNFVGIGTSSALTCTNDTEGHVHVAACYAPNAWVTGGKLKLPAAEYEIPETGSDAVAPIPLVDVTPKTEGYKDGKVYRVATPDEIANAAVTKTTTIVTDASGQITIEGLDSMLYAIKETSSPDGYLLLEKPVMMAIGSVFSGNGGKVFTEEDVKPSESNGNTYSFAPLADNSTTVKIENASGVVMPRTGGIGTTIFYVLGGVMVVFAAGVGVVVVKKRRDGDAE